MHHPKLHELVQTDPRYAYEAYEFLFAALAHTQKLLGRVPPAEGISSEQQDYHVSGRQLLEGIRDLALREYGMMARTVFRMWGIDRTDDFGEIVFRLVEADLMSKTPNDSMRDFHDIFDLDKALVEDYHIDARADGED
jgi:uncharacterized repeat protein (TIGR04138 family)